MSCEGGKQGKISLLLFVAALIRMKKVLNSTVWVFLPQWGKCREFIKQTTWLCLNPSSITGICFRKLCSCMRYIWIWSTKSIFI